MAEPETPTSIEALIEGGVRGQVAVGNYNVQIHADHGAVVHFMPPDRQPSPHLRPPPVLLRPRPVRGLVDRQADVAAALSAVESCLPVEIHGPPGIGKSTLLRHLANAAQAGTLPDGIVHLSVRQHMAEDVLQALFEAFYVCDTPFKPTAVQVRHLLQDRKALILLDDCELGREAAEELLDAGPGCAFVLASVERCLWGEGQAIHLGALPPDDAHALFERELGRSLIAEEGPAFESLYGRLQGQPLRLIQAAAQIREGWPLAEALPVEAGTARKTLAPLPDEEKCLLSVLAALGGGPVGAAHLGILADVPGLEPVINALLERKLIQAHSPRYSLTGDLAALLPTIWDLDPWRARALTYFTAWANDRWAQPEALREEMGVLLPLLDWAVQAGRYQEALNLGRAFDTSCATGGRWGIWEQGLEWIRSAAEALGDRAAQGWALHQLGTRLLCLDDRAGARTLLTQALGIREALGDRAGAAVTRHNLGLLGSLPPPSEPSGEPRPQPRSPLPLLPWLAGAILVFLGLAILGIKLLPWRAVSTGEEQPPVTTETPVVTEEPRPGPTGSPVTDQPSTDLSTTDPVTTDQLPEGPPRAKLTPAEGLDFKDVEVGQSREAPVTVTNLGDAPLTIDAITFSGERAAEELDAGGNCDGKVLGFEEACTFPVLFKPAEPGSRTLRLTLTDRTFQLDQSLEVRVSAVRAGPPSVEGWCCIGGKVGQSTDADCTARKGRFFRREWIARAQCQILEADVCCVEGEIRNESKERCAELGGVPMTAGEATIGGRCRRPEEGWCCVLGVSGVFQSSRERCESAQGRLFQTGDAARKACTPPP